jgi:hypothetical protein
VEFPSRSEVERVLAALADGSVTAAEADQWAAPFVLDESTHPEDMDGSVWGALQQLFGADVEQAPGQPLHDRADFIAWLVEFRTGASN